MSPLEETLWQHQVRPVTKWDHYFAVYEQLLGRFRGTPVRMLEIGVQFGGGLELWRRYLGPDATLFGIDINPECAGRADPPTEVRIGSQDDPAFLRAVVEEMGGVDVVLDDGSHVATHQRASFEALWPLLAEGGVYIIEDLHTAYYPQWEGGLKRPGTAVEMVKEIIDDMHGWYTGEPSTWAAKEEIGSVLVADSIVGISKVSRRPPGFFTVGRKPAG